MKDVSMRKTGNPMDNQFVYRGQLYLGAQRHQVVGLQGDRNECPSCDELFKSTSAFDKHRVGEFGKDRRCLTTAEMTAKGMDKNKYGFWVSKAWDAEGAAKVFASKENV